MISNILQILGFQPRISKVFLEHKNNFFSQLVRTILVTKYHWQILSDFELHQLLGGLFAYYCLQGLQYYTTFGLLPTDKKGSRRKNKVAPNTYVTMCNSVFQRKTNQGLLTHSIWQIHIWCPRSKWNMGEILAFLA